MKTFPFLLGLLVLLSSACKKDKHDPECSVTIPDNARFFEFGNRGNDLTFIAWTTDPTVIAHVEAQLALPVDERQQHINGKIARQPEGCDLNQEWSWYFVMNEWDLADFSIEVCDGNPQYVEDNLDDFLHVGHYCPWSSYVKGEIAAPY